MPTLSAQLMQNPGDVVSRSGLAKPTQVTGSPLGCAVFSSLNKARPSQKLEQDCSRLC